VSAILVAAVSGVIELLKSHVRVESLAVLYLLAVVPVAVIWGAALAVLVSLVSIGALAFLFFPPIYSFGVADSRQAFALVAFVVTALVVSNLSTRARRQARESARLADEQAALRRVATLAARGASPADVFAAVAAEVSRMLGGAIARIVRFEPDGTGVVVASAGDPHVAEGTRRRPEPPLALGSVARTGRDIGSSVASPIVVEGRVWGAIGVGLPGEPLPEDAEDRIAGFTELVATAISNAESRAQLTESRARIVAAADDTRRRLERDLHDGVQHQLVSLALELRAAHAALSPEIGDVRAELSRVADGLTGALDALQEISRGIHPAILSQGGLDPALTTLSRRSPVPVSLDVRVEGRLPLGVEVAAYYVVSETLANAAKHSQAAGIYVEVVEAEESLHISVRDEGVGGVDPARGSGLVGLRDRVEALGGTISVESPTGAGTVVDVALPLGPDGRAAAELSDAPSAPMGADAL
jgi:signal transduction histidine kinase